MKKEFAMLAHSYAGEDITGWLYSRKLNGWGCVWDGGITRGMLASDIPWYYRGGDKTVPLSTGLWTIGRANKDGMRPKVINAPDWWLDTLPRNISLHGELWYQDRLDVVKSICGQGIGGCNDARWHMIDYFIYNSKPYALFEGVSKIHPDPSDLINRSNLTWAMRMQNVRAILEVGSYPHCRYLQQTRVYSKEQVVELAAKADSLGWEGLMFINPHSFYEDRRSSNLLKYKPEFDAEAIIVGSVEGKNRHEGRMGALMCEITWDDKVTSFTGGLGIHVGRKVNFEIGGGFSDEERDWDHVTEHWPIGGEIHFKFFGVTKDGIPFSCNNIRG